MKNFGSVAFVTVVSFVIAICLSSVQAIGWLNPLTATNPQSETRPAKHAAKNEAESPTRDRITLRARGSAVG